MFGLIVAWVLVRYPFPGRRIVDALVDLPFALPTAVAGITLTTIYAPNGWLGQLLEPYGIKVAFTRVGVTIALIFIGLPFVVRTLQPVIEDLDPEVEEAATSLGATPVRRPDPRHPAVSLSGLADRLRAGVRARGRRVRVGGVHLRQHADATEIAPLLIITKLEQFDYAGATAIALVMLLDVVHAAARDQRPAGLERAAAGGLRDRWLDTFTRTRGTRSRSAGGT